MRFEIKYFLFNQPILRNASCVTIQIKTQTCMHGSMGRPKQQSETVVAKYWAVMYMLFQVEENLAKRVKHTELKHE